MPNPDLLPPTRWTQEELEAQLRHAIEDFRRERMEEPLEAYLEAFEERQDAFENLLETTVDLRELSKHALDILLDPQMQEAFRYLAGPPISLDDLKIVADIQSLSAKELRAKPEDAQRLIETVSLGLDRRRFPWIAENRDPSETEKHAAILASAALLASQRVATNRRSEGKNAQELLVEKTLIAAKFRKVETRTVRTLAEGPQPGHFCRESKLGTRKADVLIGLWDRRLMPIECKVSNSATNSIKRLNNDAAMKAEIWRKDFGEVNVVPTAVLSGVYNIMHLLDAQTRGLTLFWAHDLESMIGWIERTRRK
ncbi:MAG: XamI family restriction endonuclease [Acidobacteria bacterium]|nr:XamI family restriction endonuclease [Acidobacteriota bacterium]